MDKPADPATPFREVDRQFLAILAKHGRKQSTRTAVASLQPLTRPITCDGSMVSAGENRRSRLSVRVVPYDIAFTASAKPKQSVSGRLVLMITPS
jgi:hypothetical protein